MNDHDLVDHVRQTLRSAADDINVDTPPFASIGVRTAPSTRSARRRWVGPLLAAAAVAALAVAVPLVTDRGRDAGIAADARTVTVDGSTADIGGVRFPLPAGWRPVVTASTDHSVTVCVAVNPDAAPCDGVQLLIAVPDSDGSAPPLPAAFSGDDFDCGSAGTYIQADDPPPTVGGRPANHYRQSCGETGPQRHFWELTDLSLHISTPQGVWAEQGALIAAGMDLSRWPLAPGPQLVSSSSATRATR